MPQGIGYSPEVVGSLLGSGLPTHPLPTSISRSQVVQLLGDSIATETRAEDQARLQNQVAPSEGPVGLTRSDIEQLNKMGYRELLNTRGQVKDAGLLTPEVDSYFSRRLQFLNTRRGGP